LKELDFLPQPYYRRDSRRPVAGSAKEAPAAQQEQRIKQAADVLGPDIILLQEVRDYDACARLGEAIAPGI